MAASTVIPVAKIACSIRRVTDFPILSRGTSFGGRAPLPFTTPLIRLSSRAKNARTPGLFPLLATGKGDNGGRFVVDNGDYQEPFLLTLFKDIIWSVGFLFSFLAAQPGQLKYIEWPSFLSTLKTATLTLVLVAALIVALSSVDSALCYVLTMVLRKSV
ncbi:uncharacterized protein LOC144704859 [Wolffia australiana]